MVDLVGFSSHLETGAYDLRTNIGQKAIDRLQCLEEAVALLEEEKSKYAQFYPEALQIQRINDAVFLTIDLPEFLTPSICQNIRKGMSGNELEELFSEEELKDEKSFFDAYSSRLTCSVESLVKIIGLVSRLYAYINRRETKSYFPGAKAVIATGFRKPFISKTKGEDYFSANFSFSNAYIAEQQLKGPYLYLDNYIVQMLAGHPFAKNIIRYALFVSKETIFDPFEEYDDIFWLPSNCTVMSPFEVRLFRKSFYFRLMHSTPLTYLQLLPEIMPFLTGQRKPHLDHIGFKGIYESIKTGLSKEDINKKKRPSSLIYMVRNDIEDDVSLFPEFLATGKSERMERERELTIQRFIYSSESQPREEI